MSGINSAWLTLNRSCNLRCKWCYAKSAGYDAHDILKYDLACTLVNWIKDFGITNLIFTGGEPTCYGRFFEIAEYASARLPQTGIVTNGLLLADADYCQKVLGSGIRHIDVSLKGFDRESYCQNTGTDAYETAMKAIRNLAAANADFVVSMVLDGNNIAHFLRGVKDAAAQGASSFYFSFCSDFSALDTGQKVSDYNMEHHLFRVIDEFSGQYQALHELTKGKFVLHQTFPLCLWDTSLIQTMSAKHQLATSCQFLAHDGLLFDTNGSLIPCNLMYRIKLGEMGKDYDSAESLSNYLSSDTVTSFYKKIASTYPDNQCMSCRQWEFCGGGCAANWLNFSYRELQDRYQKYKSL